MDIFERIKDDHETLRTLLERIEDPDEEGRRVVFDEFQRELWAHGKIEEAVFYAALVRHREARKETMEGLNEHHVINSLAEELNVMPADSGAWTAKMQVLGELLRHHLDEEEDELFEEARDALQDDRAAELGRIFDERKKQMMAALAPLPQA
ncbi:MAG TPA: hemerythrin domain-containing protein [Azospirillum sp.]|nr:hemerythrin domain-containing protein [Azospirillum sp.]